MKTINSSTMFFLLKVTVMSEVTVNGWRVFVTHDAACFWYCLFFGCLHRFSSNKQQCALPFCTSKQYVFKAYEMVSKCVRIHQRNIFPARGLNLQERLIIRAQYSPPQHWWSIQLSSYGNVSHALQTICSLCPDKKWSWNRNENNCMLII